MLYSDGAEPFIGSLDESTVFNFSKKFCEIKDLPLVEMMDKFSTFVQNQPVAPPEIDDITAIALEIL